jgi:hypothetical protein
MPVELIIAPEAELDIAEAYMWYEVRRSGLGEEFLSRRNGGSGFPEAGAAIANAPQ